MLKADTKLKLNNNYRMPVIGLGVWQIKNGRPAEHAVKYALQAGYRQIDTAKIYGNEASVGAAIRHSHIPRDEIFVTTKLWGTDQFNVPRAYQASLNRLGLDYVDLYLVHWPVPGLVKKTWQAMETLYKSGRCRAIGVSNHSIRQLQQIINHAEIVPAVNQVKFSVFKYKPEMLKFCQNNGIILTAYSPLARGKQMDDQRLNQIADRCHKSPAQIMLRWGLQKGVVVIPKSQNHFRIKQNIDIFDFNISQADMLKLDQLSGIG